MATVVSFSGIVSLNQLNLGMFCTVFATQSSFDPFEGTQQFRLVLFYSNRGTKTTVRFKKLRDIMRSKVAQKILQATLCSYHRIHLYIILYLEAKSALVLYDGHTVQFAYLPRTVQLPFLPPEETRVYRKQMLTPRSLKEFCLIFQSTDQPYWLILIH